MSTKQRIFIPTYISSVDYQPARVQPRLLFYNGLKDCEPYFVASGSITLATNQALNAFPYFDNYSGQNTTTESLSLLFFNEEAPYGVAPTASLYTEYWEDYVELLYNPRTRLINAAAIIPLADYFKMELNDIVDFRGNYYHLRAINDYSLSDGTCKIQLLGPILPDALNLIKQDNCAFSYSISAIDCDFEFTSSIVTTTTTTTSTTTTTTTAAPITTTTTTICSTGLNPDLNKCFKVRFRNEGQPNNLVWKYYECGTGELYQGVLSSNQQFEACVVSGSFNGQNVIDICSGSTYSIVENDGSATVLGNCDLNPDNCLSITFTRTGSADFNFVKYIPCGTQTTIDTFLELNESVNLCVVSGSAAACPSCMYPFTTYTDFSYYTSPGIEVTINGTCTV
jgi:hypothetical protein